jgi:hypothetical protein
MLVIAIVLAAAFVAIYDMRDSRCFWGTLSITIALTIAIMCLMYHIPKWNQVRVEDLLYGLMVHSVVEAYWLLSSDHQK